MGSLGILEEPLQYPVARRDESIVDDYFGVKIADPYRWLEDHDSEETKEFVQNQVKLTESVLKKCDTREKLEDKIRKLIDHPRYGVPFRGGDKYFDFHNSGLQAQNVLYVQDSLDAEAEVLLDPNKLSEVKSVYLDEVSVSKDAKFSAYGLCSSGSDWVTIKVTRIADKEVLACTLSRVKFSDVSWTHDSKGLFYSQYPAPKEGDEIDARTETSSYLYPEVYYHFVGTDQSEDILCWKDTHDRNYAFGIEVMDDGKYVLLYSYKDCDLLNKIYYCEMSSLVDGFQGLRNRNELLPFAKLLEGFNAEYEVIANDDTVFTFLTNKNAPKYELARVDLKKPYVWTEVVPEAEKDVLEFACAVNGNQMLLSYLSDVKHVLQIRDLHTGSLLHQLPMDIGTVNEISARREDTVVFIRFTSFLVPHIIYQGNLQGEAPDMKIFREIVVPGFDCSEFNVDQVFVPSKDGTKIPMFIIAKKNIPLDGSHPCLLDGYGGFNISLTPSFRASVMVLVKHLGVVYCIANIRGGGEYGEEWHKAGSLAKK